MKTATPPRPTKAKAPHIAAATKYARDVVAGRIVACRYVRLACERFLDGLARQKSKAYPYRLDEVAAERVARFVELMPHVKGKWARDRERIALEPWQCFVVVNVFGWKWKRDGLRRYRRSYIEVPRKNAKSTLTAALGNYMLTADDEHGAEVYSGATTEKQAWEVFGPARLMAKNTDEYREHYGVEAGAKNLNVQATASKFEPIIGKPGDGASPSMAIIDEYHEHATSEQSDTMLTGMGAREQPLHWTITTAGSNTGGPCYSLRAEAIDVLEGAVENDELFAIVFTLDEGDDWTTDAALWKANPNMGVSVFVDFLRSEQRRAITNPREQATFKTKHLNIWLGASSPFFNLELWNQLADTSLVPELFFGDPCVEGLDLASKLDIAAGVRLFWREINGVRHYYAFPRFYVPEVRIQDAERRSYLGWVASGHMVATPGDITDYDYIEADIESDAEAHPILQVASDPYNATQLLTHLQTKLGPGKVLEVPQTVAHLSEPMKEIQALIVSGRIHHAGNPAMAWMMGNVTHVVDRNENVFPRKEAPEKKIDGAVALIIAMCAALRIKSQPKWLL